MTLLAIKDAKKNLFPNTELEKGAWVGTPAVINKGTQEQSLYRSMSKSIRLKAGTYTLSSNAGVTIGAGVQFFTTFSNIVISSNATLPQTFTLTADADIYFHFRRSDSKAWDLSNNSSDLKIQLEKGSTVTPFEEYQEIHPVPAVTPSPTLYPKKNLFDKKSTPFELGSINSADGQSSTNNLLFVVRSKGFVSIKPNTRYTFNKILTDYNFVQPYCYDSNFNYVGRALSFVFNGVSASFSTTVNTSYVRLQYNHISASYVISETERKIFDDKFQLEEGSTVTPYEEYTLVNDSPTLYPVTDLTTGIYSVMHISGVDDLATLQTGTAGTISMSVPVKQNTKYKVTKKGYSNRFMLGSFTSLTGNLRVTKQINNHALVNEGSSLEIDTGNATYLVVYLSSQNEKPPIMIQEYPYTLSNLRSE